MGTFTAVLYSYLQMFILPLISPRFRKWNWELGTCGKVCIISGLTADFLAAFQILMLILDRDAFGYNGPCVGMTWLEFVTVINCTLLAIVLLVSMVATIMRMSDAQEYAITHLNDQQRREYQNLVLYRDRSKLHPCEKPVPIMEREWNSKKLIWKEYIQYGYVCKPFHEWEKELKRDHPKWYDRLTEQSKQKSLEEWSSGSIY